MKEPFVQISKKGSKSYIDFQSKRDPRDQFAQTPQF